MQTRLNIAQKSLGKVNPVSGTAQLVLGGFRGVAVTVLWQEVLELQRRGQFLEIEPVVESITLLQPNFQKPWEFQAWNFAYNIAAEWEGVNDKYYWIHKGVDFMKNATQRIQNKPDMIWYVGFMYFSRFGQSDEKTFLRELFRKDEDAEFVQSSFGIKDNFLKSYDWFAQANNLCISTNQPPARMAPHPFMSRPALARSSYAEFLAEEGTFGAPTLEAWQKAYGEWVAFGRLGGPDRMRYIIFQLEYTPDEKAALTPEQEHWRHHYDREIRYEFWKTRCQTEAQPILQEAREAIYKAVQAKEDGAYAKSLELYEKGLPLWRQVMEQSETYRGDMLYQEICQEMEDDYLRLLAHVGRPTPPRRPFDGIVAPLRDSIASMVEQTYKDAKAAQENADGTGEPPKAPPADASQQPLAPESPGAAPINP
jgi:hypothetical protein